MSQRAVERVLGRLVTDEACREGFFRDARAALAGYIADLTADELDALLRVPRRGLAALCAELDDRICRLRVPAATHAGPAS
jgi:hypothetical protein